jgi:FkbM family methyltransferase
VSRYVAPPHNQIPPWLDILDEHIGYKDDGFFVEVGAFDGEWWSPCRTLAIAGWSGIFFEPQTRAWLKLSRNYKSHDDKIKCVKKAISDFIGTTELFLGGSASTIIPDIKELYLDVPGLDQTGLGHDKNEIVEVSTLDIELASLRAPGGFDVLVIDVEGSEIDVLNGFNIAAWSPGLVVIEAYEQHDDTRMSAKALPMNKYMAWFGYKKIYSDAINNIYVLRR